MSLVENLISAVSRAGGTITPNGDRLKISVPQGALSRRVLDQLRQHKSELLAHLSGPMPRPQDATSAPAHLGWDEETAFHIAWFQSAPIPSEAFDLYQGVQVKEPVKFWQAIRNDIRVGPHGPRAYYGPLQKDVSVLYGLFGQGTLAH